MDRMYLDVKVQNGEPPKEPHRDSPSRSGRRAWTGVMGYLKSEVLGQRLGGGSKLYSCLEIPENSLFRCDPPGITT